MDYSLPSFDQRILVGVAATLSWQPLDSDGEPTTASTVTVDVTKADGTTVVTAGATTGTSPITYTLAAPTTMDWLTATWKVSGTARATTHIEVVGGYWDSVANIRAKESALASSATYPTAALVRARWDAEREAESLAHVAFVPRYGRFRMAGNDRSSLRLPVGRLRSVRSVRLYSSATTYTSLTADELANIPADTAGIATRRDGNVWPCGYDVVLEVEHGYDRPPADLLELFPARVRWFANRGQAALDDDVITFQGPDGTSRTVDMLARRWYAKLGTYGATPPGWAG